MFTPAERDFKWVIGKRKKTLATFSVCLSEPLISGSPDTKNALREWDLSAYVVIQQSSLLKSFFYLGDPYDTAKT